MKVLIFGIFAILVVAASSAPRPEFPENPLKPFVRVARANPEPKGADLEGSESAYISYPYYYPYYYGYHYPYVLVGK